jgi:hypothetical protein
MLIILFFSSDHGGKVWKGINVRAFLFLLFFSFYTSILLPLECLVGAWYFIFLSIYAFVVYVLISRWLFSLLNYLELGNLPKFLCFVSCHSCQLVYCDIITSYSFAFSSSMCIWFYIKTILFLLCKRRRPELVWKTHQCRNFPG